tara:strand:- start:90 stop:1007 length:918 start_codon:yes stop_codon:yes gene_type:complete
VSDDRVDIGSIATDDVAGLMEQGFTPADSYAEVKGEDLTMSPALSETSREVPQPEDTGQPEVKEQTEDNVNQTYKFGDQEYSQDDILKALDDHSNKEKWQKSYTERDQELAEHRKTLETGLKSELDKWQTVRQDEKLMNTLKDFLGDDHPLFTESTVNLTDSNVQNTESVPTQDAQPSNDALEEIRNELEQLKADKQLETDVVNLKAKYPALDNAAVDEVIKTAIDNDISDLENAYKIARFDSAETSAISKAHNAFEEAQRLKEIPETSGETAGDKEVPTPQLNSDADVRDFMLREYGNSLFNND